MSASFAILKFYMHLCLKKVMVLYKISNVFYYLIPINLYEEQIICWAPTFIDSGVNKPLSNGTYDLSSYVPNFEKKKLKLSFTFKISLGLIIFY